MSYEVYYYIMKRSEEQENKVYGDNDVTIRTENSGIIQKNTASITNGNDSIYVALTGDQTTITNIRISTV